MTRAEALTELLRYLKNARYHFTAITPATHSRVVARELKGVPDLRDIFGWSRAFRASDVDPDLLALLRAAEAIEETHDGLRSRVRVASLGSDLVLHSAFPTEAADAVFFGPDTYRFARFIEAELPRLAGHRKLIDMGAGSGAGTIAALRVRQFDSATMVDINPTALELATINARFAGLQAGTLLSERVSEAADLVIANPPYMIDASARTYRDGGELLGGAVALDWAQQALRALAPGGSMLLYTGAAYVGGQAPLLTRLEQECSKAGATLNVVEIDPDVFGEELDQPAYQNVERIAAVGAVITTPDR